MEGGQALLAPSFFLKRFIPFAPLLKESFSLFRRDQEGRHFRGFTCFVQGDINEIGGQRLLPALLGEVLGFHLGADFAGSNTLR